MNHHPSTPILAESHTKVTSSNVIYLPPRFRGDSERVRQQGRQPNDLDAGQRIGHLVTQFPYEWVTVILVDVWETEESQGQQFAGEFAIAPEPMPDSEPDNVWWLCLCDCGRHHRVREWSLITG